MEFLAELHPKVVHFPIALLISSVLFDVIGLFSGKEFYHKSSHLLLFLGVLGAFAASVSGNQAFIAYLFWNDSSRKVFENHEFFANVTIWYFALLLILRTFFVLKKKYISSIKYLIIVLSLAGCYFIFQTSEYGGELVKKFGIGTELVPDQSSEND